MPDETLPIPLDIPWQLAASTQERHQTPYDPFLDSSISLFYYEPKTENLAADYPNERVIYLKAVVTIYPAKMPPEFGQLWIDPPIYISDYLVGLSGVWHALFDLKVRPDPDTTDLIRPYFHAAVPTSREMIQTGVIGSDQAEASSNSVAVGKSATQLHETILSSANTRSEGGGFDVKALSYSKGSTSTDVYTERTLNETIDTTHREAAQERRELLSHHTEVSNVLSLLSAYHIGSPYTRFSLWPRPISLLSLDPGDPNLWYMELLRRRSSGLEGIQEFFLVLMVPKNQDFCIEAELKRFFVADNVPTPPKFDYKFGWLPQSEPELVETINLVEAYLYNRFPRGTPLDDLDLKVDVSKLPAAKFPRPCVNRWAVHVDESSSADGIIKLYFVSPSKLTEESKPSIKPTTVNHGETNYKSWNEVYLEAAVAQYEEELARSPLERGLIVMAPTLLTTCYTLQNDQPISIKSYKAPHSNPVLGPAPTIPSEDVGAGADGSPYEAAALLAKGGQSPTRRGRAVIARWNQLQRAFSRQLELTRDWTPPSMDLSDSRIYSLFLSAAANLAPSDPRNIATSELVHRLPLPEKARAQLSKSGLATLRDLALYLKGAPAVEEPLFDVGPTRTGKGRTRNAVAMRRLGTVRLPFDRETRDAIVDAMRKMTPPNSGA